MPEHVIDGRLSGEEGPAVGKCNPAVGPGFAEVDVERFVDSDEKGNAHEGVLIEFAAAWLGAPCVVGGGGDAAEKSARLRFVERPFFGEFDERF